MRLALGLYALYFLLVAVKGNAQKVFSALQTDMPGFLPWLIVAGVLGALYQFAPTRQFAGLFIVLVVLAFFLKNQNTLVSQFHTIYNQSTVTTTNATATTSATP